MKWASCPFGRMQWAEERTAAAAFTSCPFLACRHLPAYLVAAFAKRLGRLALTAPPDALLMVTPFICNLLRRHPSCKALVHRPGGPEGQRRKMELGSLSSGPEVCSAWASDALGWHPSTCGSGSQWGHEASFWGSRQFFKAWAREGLDPTQ